MSTHKYVFFIFLNRQETSGLVNFLIILFSTLVFKYKAVLRVNTYHGVALGVQDVGGDARYNFLP